MSPALYPALVAALVGTGLAVVAFVPYVALTFRRRGDLGPGRALLALAALVHAVALAAYVVLPLPQVGPGFCANGGAPPQTRPLQLIADVVREGVGSPAALAANPALAGAVLNVALFVPLGALLRHLRGTRVVTVTAVGLVVSLLLETTQLTGDWFAYPCAYRTFDVDDLVLNTLGALVGALAAPLLARVPGQRAPAPAGAARPVTTWRRLTGMVCDALAVLGLGTALTGAASLIGSELLDRPLGPEDLGPLADVLAWGVPGLGQLALVLATGRTLGEMAVRLAPAPGPVAGRLPPLRARALRWLVGTGGWCVLGLLGAAGGLTGACLVLLSAVAAARSRGHRGLAHAVAGLDVVDERAVPAPVRPRDPDRGA